MYGIPICGISHNLLTCLDLPYRSAINTQTAQPEKGEIIGSISYELGHKELLIPNKGTACDVDGKFSMTTMMKTVIARKTVTDSDILSSESGGRQNDRAPMISNNVIGIPKLNT